MIGEPNWLTTARKYVGVSEIPGPQTSTVIRAWLTKLKAWWTDDETPWCGTFVAAVLDENGLPLAKHWYRAKGWLDYGTILGAPTLGCIVVFERQGGGHVGFVVGRDLEGRLLVLGGNQGNKVSIAAFDPARVVGYRWPSLFAPGVPAPVFASTVAASRNEA